MADRARILVADDEELERRALRRILAELGEDVEIVEAENGRLAVEVAERLRIDLAFLDIRMPGMSGLEVAKVLRASQNGLRIVFLTAFDTFDFAREALRIGVDEYLVKPAEPAAVLDTATRALELLRSARNEAERERAALGDRARALSLLEAELGRSFSRGDADPEHLDAWLELRGQSEAPRFSAALRVSREFHATEMGRHSAGRSAEDTHSAGEMRSLAAASDGKRLAALSAALLRDEGYAVIAAPVTARPGDVFLLAAGDAAADPSEVLGTLVKRAAADLSLRIRCVAAPGPQDYRVPLFEIVSEALVLAKPGAEPLVLARRESDRCDVAAGTAAAEIGGAAFVERALAFLRADLSRDRSLADAATAAGCSSYHLSRLFPQRTGDTFTRAYARLRVDTAKSLLATGKYSIKEVGKLVGFADQAYFAKVFKRLEGHTPAEFRARLSSG